MTVHSMRQDIHKRRVVGGAFDTSLLIPLAHHHVSYSSKKPLLKLKFRIHEFMTETAEEMPMFQKYIFSIKIESSQSIEYCTRFIVVIYKR